MHKKHTVLFLILLIAAALLIIGLSSFGLRGYSARENEKAMENMFEEIDEVIMKNQDDFVDYESLERIVLEYSSKYNYSITIYNAETNKILITNERDNEELISEIRESIFSGKEIPGISFKYCSDNKTIVAINVPQESLSEAAATSNRWVAFVTIITLFIVVIAMLLLNKRLDQVEELEKENEKLRISLEEKEKQNDIQKEFVSSVSHELKTPLTLIEGYAEALKDGIASDVKTRNEYCETIVDEAGRMDRIVKQLLLLSSLESGTEELVKENFDFSEMVAGITENTRLLADKKGAVIETNIEPELYINADEFKMESVVTNYLQNAIHHVSENGTITVTLKRTETTGTGSVRLSVFNTGDNIPEESINNIWDKFYKVDKARTRAYGGSGIGLSIVKAVMDAHGGNYGVRNLPGGVEFFLTI